MSSLPAVRIENQSKFQAPPKKESKPVSWGARTLCSILYCYNGKAEMRSATWQHQTVNDHLERTGRSPITRATFFRWKAEARATGLLKFRPWGFHRRNRKRNRPGRGPGGTGLWMRVVAIPFAVEGRRPRRSKLDETYGEPPPNETCGEANGILPPIGITPHLKDRANHETTVGEVAAKKNLRGSSPAFPKEILETERYLVELAEMGAEFMGIDYRASPDSAFKRIGAIRKAFKVGVALHDLKILVLAMVDSRSKSPEWWDASGFDLVARGCAYAYQDDLEVSPQFWDSLDRRGERLLQEIEVYREAMVGEAR